MDFIPATIDEIKELGWERPDIILVTGDAYIDHPSFGTAIIARLAESVGLKVVVLAQPNWKDDLRDFKKFGIPSLFFGVTAGAMDSMVNHYTALKRKRSNDAFTPGGRAGYRPDYASIVYSRILKKLYPDVPVVLGGVEASLRRLTHYDYWSDSVKPSVLVDSSADLLLYGMAEQAFLELIRIVSTKGFSIENIRQIQQIAYIEKQSVSIENYNNSLTLPSFEDCVKSKKKFAEAYKLTEINSNPYLKKTLLQKTNQSVVVINPPYLPEQIENIDYIYDLPFTRKPHPKYNTKPPVPAYDMIRNSVTIHRGCFGACSFCAIASHQGKFILSRSENSILNELLKVASASDFSGHITDLGGPTANMFQMKGKDLNICAKCRKPSCLFPDVCRNLQFNHFPLLDLYEKADKISGIKKITIGSGIRYDLLVGHTGETDRKFGLSKYTEKLVGFHVSGRLKVAPEHVSERVLNLMRKPSFDLLQEFVTNFKKFNIKFNKNQQLVVYLIAGHPGCSMNDMEVLAEKVRKYNILTEPIQEFTPTPMTLSTTIYYTGINPYTGENVQVHKNSNEIRKQKMIVSTRRKKRKI